MINKVAALDRGYERLYEIERVLDKMFIQRLKIKRLKNVLKIKCSYSVGYFKTLGYKKLAEF